MRKHDEHTKHCRKFCERTLRTGISFDTPQSSSWKVPRVNLTWKTLERELCGRPVQPGGVIGNVSSYHGVLRWTIERMRWFTVETGGCESAGWSGSTIFSSFIIRRSRDLHW